MPALTTPYESLERPGIVVSYKISNVKIWKGALLGVNASGLVVPLGHGTASLKFVGVAAESLDNSGGTAGTRSVNVTKAGTFVFSPFGSFDPVQTTLGSEVYSGTDHQVQTGTTGLTSAYKVGTITSIETTSLGANGVRVRIDNHTL